MDDALHALLGRKAVSRYTQTAVIDDNGIFIGIVTRKSIIEYCYKQYKAVSSAQAGVEKVTEL